ncbi:G-type lectin S-receptor-like serine/threonine-protein kinase At1g11330 [Gossypium hirsutum]|uniref:G-type lectin S-receptor-like serine/threonine-protein kinase At1g11330 n=1 Tax=Gossypium hirsutum TaxID=3635 RepID=A0ABM2ZK97_GOSHI|nr:G-type lectin S-receptor-like serine/threonine-protein kinase At1g11330 [Gossypium hirsutum]
MMKVPAFPDWSSGIYSECKDQCLKNCSCVAYAHDDGIGCMFWGRDLIDVQKFSTSGVDLYIRLPSSELDKGKSNKVIVITTVITGIVVITISALFLWCRMAKQRGRNKIRRQIEDEEENLIGAKLQQLPLFNFEELATATDNFHHTKKLGQGGFGPVYRGTLDDGKEIAVKRLSKASGQGLEEFKNEVVVISKLQHRNLVKLFGCCVEGEEKMLVYEYMPNKSLDSFLFG